MKTIIYLSECSDQLKKLKLDRYFPETELHPKEVVKIIPELIGKSFCTHSQVIVNQIGHLIADRLINFDDVEVYIVLHDGTEVRYEFDKEGYLINWDVGFFWLENFFGFEPKSFLKHNQTTY